MKLILNRNRTMVAAGVLSAAALTAAGVAVATDGVPADPYANLPASISLAGVVRDFKGVDQTGGHADFERTPSSGFAHYVGECQDLLDSEGKPVFNNTGRKVNTEYRDASGRNRIPNREYIASRSGDVNGSVATTNGGSSTTSENFSKWFRDVAGVNMSHPLSINLVRQPNSNMYTFNDQTDSFYQGRNGFFPINGELWGNSGGTTPNQNFHFTYQIDTTFVYHRNAGQVFTFIGDDDVFVFVDNKLVIDIGGVHSAVNQTIEMDRLSWLQDGQHYSLKFFFAERHRTQSNFRIDTTLNLENAQLPSTSALYD